MNSHQDDLLIMQRVARGEPEAFRVLYETHKRRVYGICLRLMGRGTGAEDMAQEVWIKIVKNASQYRPIAGLAAWISQVTRNACLNALRTNRPEDFVEDIEETAEASTVADGSDPFGNMTDHESLERAFAVLPTQQRAVLLMAVYDEMSHAEIAAELGLSVGAVKQLIFRAKDGLRAHFKERA